MCSIKQTRELESRIVSAFAHFRPIRPVAGLVLGSSDFICYERTYRNLNDIVDTAKKMLTKGSSA
jgi:hypothetical protein